MVLPTDVTPGYPGHADLHNNVNEAVNALDVSATYTDAVGPPQVRLSRRGAWVQAEFTAGGPDGPHLGAVPAGYRPDTSLNGYAYLTGVDADDNPCTGRVVSTSGDLYVFSTSGECYLSGVWLTADPDPS